MGAEGRPKCRPESASCSSEDGGLLSNVTSMKAK